MAQDVERDVHIGNALGVADVQHGVLVAERQGGQQAGNQLRAAAAGDVRRAGDEVPADAGRDEHLLEFVRGFAGEEHAEGGHDVGGAAEGPLRQGAVAVDGEDPVSHGSEHGYHQARQQPRLARVQAFQVQLAGAGADAGDGQPGAVAFHFRAQRLCHAEGRFGVAAGAVTVQVGGTFRQGGGDDGPLRETLRSGHRAAFRPVGLPLTVQGPTHFVGRPLPGGGGFRPVQGGISEGGAAPQAFQAGLPARFPHPEGHQAPLERVHAFQDDGVERFDAVRVFLILARRHHLGDVRAVAETAGEGHLQDAFVRGLLEVVVRADDLGAVAPAELLETLAHRGRGLDLEVGEAGACLDGEVQAPFGFLLRAGLGDAAGGDEGGVGLAEEFGNLFVREGTAVQADFRHLDRRVREDLQDLSVGLILQADANHPGL